MVEKGLLVFVECSSYAQRFILFHTILDKSDSSAINLSSQFKLTFLQITCIIFEYSLIPEFDRSYFYLFFSFAPLYSCPTPSSRILELSVSVLQALHIREIPSILVIRARESRNQLIFQNCHGSNQIALE